MTSSWIFLLDNRPFAFLTRFVKLEYSIVMLPIGLCKAYVLVEHHTRAGLLLDSPDSLLSFTSTLHFCPNFLFSLLRFTSKFFLTVFSFPSNFFRVCLASPRTFSQKIGVFSCLTSSFKTATPPLTLSRPLKM